MNIIEAVKLMPAQPETENLAYELGRHDQRFIPATPVMGALHPEVRGFAFLGGPEGTSIICSETDEELPLDVRLLDDRWTLAPLEDLQRIASTQKKTLGPNEKVLIGVFVFAACAALFQYLTGIHP